MIHDKDIFLFTEIKQGNKDALSTLFLNYYDYLLHYGIRINNNETIVEECIQELFLYIFEASDRLGTVSNVKAYLFSALRRRILHKLKKEKGQLLQEYLIPNRTNIQFSAEELLIRKEEQNLPSTILLDTLNNLPWRQREAIYLRYYNGLSTKEIATIMGIANQTVLNTIYQGLNKMRVNKQLKKMIGLSSTWILISLLEGFGGVVT